MSHWSKVLVRHPGKSQGTIRRYYDKWRSEKGIPLRCDNPICDFHKSPLVWNGKKLKMILDHIDGDKLNNQPSNLRYVCPNCNAQLETHGGANRGRVESSTKDGSVLVNPDGSKDACSRGHAQFGFSASAGGVAAAVTEPENGTL